MYMGYLLFFQFGIFLLFFKFVTAIFLGGKAHSLEPVSVVWFLEFHFR